MSENFYLNEVKMSENDMAKIQKCHFKIPTFSQSF